MNVSKVCVCVREQARRHNTYPLPKPTQSLLNVYKVRFGDVYAVHFEIFVHLDDAQHILPLALKDTAEGDGEGERGD